MAKFFSRLMARFGRKKVGVRLYAGARNNRLTLGFGSGGRSSADAELHTSLSVLRARSREVVRDSSYAKRAKLIVVNNVIGSGIGLQAQVMNTRNSLRMDVNDAIETEWYEWCSALRCHTGGALHFSDLERMAMGQVFEAGEVFIRVHFRAFGDSRVPVALEVVEAERLADDTFMLTALAPDSFVKMGVEVDRFGRAQAYWIRKGHPGDLREQPNADQFERVPAADVFHLRIVDRWPQTRGEPWLHSTLRKLNDIDEYTGAELQAARAASYYFGTIETPEAANPLADIPNDGANAAQMSIEPLTVQQMAPGEKFEFHNPSRPNQALDPFLRYMLREVASGVGVSYESLSRDYSQSNYSSSRLALLDDRDTWKTLQQWWVRSFREPLHRMWIRLAIQSRAISSIGVEEYALNMRKFEAALFKCRGWSWIDPAKEQDAYAAAVRNGFMTVTDVIAQTGGGLDIEDVIRTRRRELDMLEEAGIEVETTVKQEVQPAAPVAAPDPEPEEPPDDGEDEEEEPQARLFSFGSR